MAENKLETYRKKRNFGVTNEPGGKVGRSGNALRFSVQHHAARADHFDLRLELGGVALSWAVPKGPSYCTADKRLAMRVEDHPVDYMDFEGVIPKGEYGGGTVMLWDEGVWTPLLDPVRGLKEGSLKFHLDGERLKGDWTLVRMRSEERGDPWLLIKERDGAEKRTAGISRFTRGVRSGKSMAEIAQAGEENPFQRAEVMLARPCEELPRGTGWLFELKYDGHRTLGFLEKGRATLKTRNGYDSTARFPLAAQALEKAFHGRAAVVDGEMVVVGKDGVPDFGALQAYDGGNTQGLCYILFDLLALDGKDLRDAPLSERKEKLKALLVDAPPVLAYSEHTRRMTHAMLETLKARGVEGVVCKRADGTYTAGKNGDWLKLKFRGAQEFVIGGYTLSDAGELRALLVGRYENGALRFTGRVGTGFSDRTRRELAEKFSKLGRNTSPFASVPANCKKGAHWLAPKLAAQVEFAEITSSGLLRQASFKGLRTDKLPEEITEDVQKTWVRPAKNGTNRLSSDSGTAFFGVKITHPEKLMFPRPKITKGELAAYYAAVGGRMLPYLKDRFLSLVCCPEGIGGEQFFRRHLEGTFQGVNFASAGKDGPFFVTGVKGILSLAQYNAVEFHIQGCKTGGTPDVMVFDLDPDEGLPLADVRRGARELKKTLDGLGLVSFLKTSGGKGYHIVVPFRESADREQFRLFSEQVALLMERQFPALFTANMSKKARAGKIYLDWQRNGPSATSAAPYSVRAREGAPVSMPIAWEELSRVAPASVTLRTALKRLEKPDPWRDFFAVKRVQRLKQH